MDTMEPGHVAIHRPVDRHLRYVRVPHAPRGMASMQWARAPLPQEFATWAAGPHPPALEGATRS